MNKQKKINLIIFLLCPKKNDEIFFLFLYYNENKARFVTKKKKI